MTDGREFQSLHTGCPWPSRRAVGVLYRLALFACFCASAAAAQTVPGAIPDGDAAFVHESWTVQDGLPVNSVTDLLQSRDGYLWIGTFDGLVRFDGVRLTIYNSASMPGLPSNRIIGLLEARDGSVWSRTDQWQLIRFRDGHFTHFGVEHGIADGVRAFREDANGTLWVGTDRGLGRIVGERFVAVTPATIPGGVHAIAADPSGDVWAGTSTGGLYRIANDVATEISAGEALDAVAVSALYVDPRGALWVGTNRGVWRYRDAFERIAASQQVLEFRASPITGDIWILTQTAVLRHDGRRLVHVLDRSPDPFRSGRLVLDQAGRMLYPSGPELHREGRHVYTLPQPYGGERSQSQNVTSALLDHEGSLWLGTVGTGLHRLKQSRFTVYSEPEGLSGPNVYSVFEDRAGAVWIGTLGRGINRLAGGRITKLGPEQGFPAAVLSLQQDRAGRIWAGGAGGDGVRVCTPPALRCTRPTPDPIANAGVRAIHEDAAGALWFGTTAGLFRLDDGGWTRFAGPDAPAFTVRVFLETADRALWMGSNGGGLTRHQAGRFSHVTTADGLPDDLIRSLYQDADGWLWVGTEGRGLARLDPRAWAEDPRGGRMVEFRTADGLFDDVIHQILEDDVGRLWMSSNRGIFRVDRLELLDFAEGRIARIHSTGYTERDGLRNREANGGSQPAGMRASDGRLWFATQDGVAVVDPARVEHNAIRPGVVVEQVTAGGTRLRPGPTPLQLGVEQRDLEIEYTALSFLAPANVQFRYRLDPYDAEWIEAGSRRTAFYTQVPPGRYTFRVIASNNDGVWNEDGANLDLRLAPRFRETGMFRLLGLLAIAGLAGAGFRWRVRNLQARTRELGRLVDERTRELRDHQQRLAAQNAQLERHTGELEELDHAKSRFFANVSHEFRTPLTLILGPLRDLTAGRSGELPGALRGQLDLMLRNAQRLLRMVNQVLDLSRLESGSLPLHVQPHDLAVLARAVTRSFLPLAERRRIALDLDLQVARMMVAVDVEQMEKVLLNLLSNAFKFTDPGGRVVVTLREDEGSGVVEVRDTGIGIAPDQLPSVFDRFYQADGSATRRYEGTGIGLSLARELVELHGGRIAATSRPGAGSTFVVRLPLRHDVQVADPEASPLDVPGIPSHPPHYPPGAGQPSAGAVQAGSEEAGDGADRTTILVVDDHADVRAYVRSVLEPDFLVLEAQDGQEGLETARRALPDLVVADVMMPRLDGFGLTRALREDPATDCIPTILLTARAGADDEVEGIEAGADDYVAKPFHASVLHARVTGLIASRLRLRERFRREGLPASAAVPDAPRSDLEVRLRSIVEENLTEQDFNPDALAAAAGLHYKQLHRRLAAELHATPSRFIRCVRVERAADLLRDGAGSITEVAYSVGFNSLSYFHRAFRERFGVAPSALIKPRS
jgi:signal transduction histidine kinase/DNA-binding response OmpR family regulator